MIGVVPLGTGNDMARVLGWGAQCHDDEKIPTILSEMEQSSFKLMDRWSIQYSPESDLDISSIITAITVSKTLQFVLLKIDTVYSGMMWSMLLTKE